LERTKVLIELRQLTAPIDGIIVKLHAAEGIWMREGDPILEIMKLDTLWAMGIVSIREHEMNDLDGKPAAVSVTFANGNTEHFQGKVVFCDPNIQAGNTYHVYVEVQNRRSGNFWMLQPGRNDAEIVIQL
jgi:multidrug resistance efflux pump